MKINDVIKNLILQSAVDKDELKRATEEDRKMCLKMGEIHGNYQAGQLCGRGGIGELRYGFNLETGQQVVLKYPRPGLFFIMGDLLEELFDREAETLKTLRHPNIVEAYDAFDHNGMLHIPMECIYLGLDTFFGEKPDVQNAYLFMRDAVRALKHSHEHEIVHCDVKPFNFRVAAADDGTVSVKLADWGSSRYFGEPTVRMISTPAYYPCKAGLKTVDPTIDLYGFGKTVLRIMLSSTDLPSKEISERMQNGNDEENMKVLVDGFVPPALVNFIIHPCLEAPKGNGFTTSDLEKEIDGLGILFGFKYERISRNLYTGVVTATEKRLVFEEEREISKLI